ncbi:MULTISPECIES: HigA family addiction module antitoxin [unclassified Janthinobacterium]|uniref:HigA family addiction module antitoxin n=1 Tax=unclassified Janthinobacterium TaxID=2610881 RepID=UPI001618CF80|nr:MULTISPECIES: HigA family addiction module antitoxin [unclassified Janthinobacterium]MBB5371700.1 addiction module HigA family antidote [Janthinobacterium sp. K2C7]MBB5384505.1 addiction module HigA family antidote [Janthinobacterium sp. K2Li3]MBB5389781.1 addiction module HigA family antidote [Janthinobacterium sp. K2E3]
MSRQHNPPYPGEVIREFLGEMTIPDAATRLGVDHVTLQQVITGAVRISHDMALRLGDVFGTSSEIWSEMQLQFDLYQVGKIKHPKN